MTDNNIQIFKNKDFGEIRTIVEGDDVLFCGSDVAKALNYSNTRHALSVHCNGVVKRDTPTKGGIQELSYIPESDVYRLVFRSKLSAAEKFASWVAEDVLPSIRKHGAYMTPETLEKALTSPDFIIQLATKLKAEQEKVRRLEPKADYYDMILQGEDLIPTTIIAKDYGMTVENFNKLLHSMGIQFNLSGLWVLYQKHAEKGYTHTKTYTYKNSKGKNKVNMLTYWTQKGRYFIYETLKNCGIVPTYEKEIEY